MPKKKSKPTSKRPSKSVPILRTLDPPPPYPGDQNLIPRTPYLTTPQPGEVGYKFKDSVEAPYELLGGLDLQDYKQIRRVMAMIHDPLSEETMVLNAKYSAKRLHRWERAIVRRIISETKGNYLLFRMITWLGTYWNKTDDEVYHALCQVLDNATIYVRRRYLYEEDYMAAKEGWKKFVGSSWEDTNGLMDPEPGTEEINRADHRDPDYEARRQTHESTFKYEYFWEELYEDGAGYLTEEDAPGDFPDESKEADSVKHNIFSEEPKSMGRLRSGKSRGDELQYEINFPSLRVLIEKERADQGHPQEETTKKPSSTKKDLSISKTKPVPGKKAVQMEDDDYVDGPQRESMSKRKKTVDDATGSGKRVTTEIKGTQETKKSKKKIYLLSEKPKGKKPQSVTGEVEDDYGKKFKEQIQRGSERWKLDHYTHSKEGSSEGGKAMVFYPPKSKQPVTVPESVNPSASSFSTSISTLFSRPIGQALPTPVPQFSTTQSRSRYPFVSVAQSLGLAPPINPHVYQPAILPGMQQAEGYKSRSRSVSPTLPALPDSPSTFPKHAYERQQSEQIGKNVSISTRSNASGSVSYLHRAGTSFTSTTSSSDDAMFNTNPILPANPKLNTFEGTAPIPKYTPALPIRRGTPSVSRLNSPSIERLNMLNEAYEIDDYGVKKRGSAPSSQADESPRRRIVG